MSLIGSIILLYCLLLVISIVYGMTYAKTSSTPKPLSQVLHVTVSNLRGHQALYQKGWFIVSASAKAFLYVKHDSITASYHAIVFSGETIKAHSTRYSRQLGQARKEGILLGKNIYRNRIRTGRRIVSFTQNLIKREWRAGITYLKFARQCFIRKNKTIVRRTREDRASLVGLPVKTYTSIMDDFKNARMFISMITEKISLQVAGRWNESFRYAKKAFNDFYEASGDSSNSLYGLGFILIGYMGAINRGFIQPGIRALVQGVIIIFKVVVKLILLPAALVLVLIVRLLQFCVTIFYYILSILVKVLSPTLKSLYLLSLFLFLCAAIPFSVIIAVLLMVSNLILAVVLVPSAVIGFIILVSSFRSIVYISLLAYAVSLGAGRVIFYQARSMLVLIYNLLTALPIHLLLGTMNVAVLLIYDAPRLAITSVRGDVQWRKVQPG